MKKKLMVATLALSGLMLCACQATSPPANATTSSTDTAAASKNDPKVIEELKELLAKHDKALNDKNLDAVISTFSTDPSTVVLGTGEGERYQGVESIKQAYTEIFKDYDAGTLNTACESKTGGVDQGGSMAWLAAVCKARDSMKSVKRDYTLNVSAAVVKQDNGWHFVLLHMSNTPNGPPPPSATTK